MQQERLEIYRELLNQHCLLLYLLVVRAVYNLESYDILPMEYMQSVRWRTKHQMELLLL